MRYRWYVTFFLDSLIYICVLFQASSQSSSISLTDDRPPDNLKVTELGKDVALSWSFSYNDPAVITHGPWEARDVKEITFGIWKSIDDRILLTKKIVAVDCNGTFMVRSKYDSKMDWSSSKYKLTFTLKGFTVQDQATYGINVEFGLTQKSLEDTVSVTVGASYIGQDGNSTVQNETAYTSENVDLLFKRSADDQIDDFSKYRIYKGNVTIITIGKEQDGKDGSCAVSQFLDQCHKRYSLRYVNKTYVSFRLRNVTLQDSGLYLCQAYFLGMHDPEYAEINFIVQEEPATSTQAYETLAPKAKGGHSVAAADKLAEDTVYSIPSGETAKIFSRRSNREELTEFKEYRVWKDNVTFAIITNLTVTATCPDNVLQQFCLTKIEFKIWNVTHLILKVKNTTHDDSGNYFVEHVFGGMEGNHRDKIILNIEASPTGTTLSQGITTEDNKLSSSIGLPSSTTSKSSAVSSGGISFSRAAWSLLLLLLLCVFIKVNSVDLI